MVVAAHRTGRPAPRGTTQPAGTTSEGENAHGRKMSVMSNPGGLPFDATTALIGPLKLVSSKMNPEGIGIDTFNVAVAPYPSHTVVPVFTIVTLRRRPMDGTICADDAPGVAAK